MKAERRRVYHPFRPFVPDGSTSLLLGTFPGSHSTGNDTPAGDWYYSARANQFWPIMRSVFPKAELDSVLEKKRLMSNIGMAVSDIILSCVRYNGSNQDKYLKDRCYNTEEIESILTMNPVKRILFTGRGVMREFEKHFSCSVSTELIALPSPSPAFCRMTLHEKTLEYLDVFSYAGITTSG